MLCAMFGLNWLSIVLEKKAFKFCLYIFSSSLLSQLFKRVCPFIWTNLIPFTHNYLMRSLVQPRFYFLILSMYFAYFAIISTLKFKFCWNWLRGSEEKDFKILLKYFCYFGIIFSWKRSGPWTSAIPLNQRVLCAKSV